MDLRFLKARKCLAHHRCFDEWISKRAKFHLLIRKIDLFQNMVMSSDLIIPKSNHVIIMQYKSKLSHFFKFILVCFIFLRKSLKVTIQILTFREPWTLVILNYFIVLLNEKWQGKHFAKRCCGSQVCTVKNLNFFFRISAIIFCLTLKANGPLYVAVYLLKNHF